MIALNSLQVIFEKYLNSDSTNLLEFITSNNFATITASGEIEFLITMPIERFDESKIDYKNIDYIKLGECLSFLDEVKGQLTAADLSLAKRWVANRIEVAFTEGKQLGSRKNVEKLIKDFEVYKNKTVDMRKKHPTVNKAQKVGKSVLGGGAAAGIAGGIVAAALTNGAAISSIPGLTANAAINFGVGASWGVVAAAVLGVSYYSIKHLVTTTVNKAKFKGKKSIELIENADKENIYEMEDVPSIEFLKLFAEKAADIIDFKPSKFNIPGKIVKYFKIKANRNRLHTIENHFKKDIVAEMERISKLLESDSYNKDLINKLARLQSYAAVINSVLDDVAMEDYRDLLSGDSKTRHSTYMDIILGADKKRNIINSKGRIHNAAKFDKLATEEEKDAKQESSLSYNGKKPKELKRASSLYGASLIARALSLDNAEKSLIQARLDKNAEVRQNKLNEKKSRKDAKQAKKDAKIEEKVDNQQEPLINEYNDLQQQLTDEINDTAFYKQYTREDTIKKINAQIENKLTEIAKLEMSRPSFVGSLQNYSPETLKLFAEILNNKENMTKAEQDELNLIVKEICKQAEISPKTNNKTDRLTTWKKLQNEQAQKPATLHDEILANKLYTAYYELKQNNQQAVQKPVEQKPVEQKPVEQKPSVEEKTPEQPVQTRNIKEFSNDDLLKIKAQLEEDLKEKGSLSISHKKLYDLTIAELKEREKVTEKPVEEKPVEQKPSVEEKTPEQPVEEKPANLITKTNEVKANQDDVIAKQDELFVRYEDEEDEKTDTKGKSIAFSKFSNLSKNLNKILNSIIQVVTDDLDRDIKAIKIQSLKAKFINKIDQLKTEAESDDELKSWLNNYIARTKNSKRYGNILKLYNFDSNSFINENPRKFLDE